MNLLEPLANPSLPPSPFQGDPPLLGYLHEPLRLSSLLETLQNRSLAIR